MTVQWILGHNGIERNIISDAEAKRYAQIPVISLAQAVYTLANGKREVRRRKDKEWKTVWDSKSSSGARQIYKDLGLKPTSQPKLFPELSLMREILGWLSASRSEHGHFAVYHERFGHDETDIWCRCGQRRAQLHPFSSAKCN